MSVALAIVTLGASLVATVGDLSGQKWTGRLAGGNVAGMPSAIDTSSPLTGTWHSFANGDRVSAVLRDGDVVWAATAGGGLIRWAANGSYRQWLSPQDGMPNNDVRDVALGPDGDIWLATANGIARLDRVSGNVIETHRSATSPGMPAQSATALAFAPDGALWVGFEQRWDPVRPHPLADRGAPPGAFGPGGVARFDPSTRIWSEHHPAIVHVPAPSDPSPEVRFAGLPSDNVTDVAFGTDGAMWVATRPFYLWDAGACNQPVCFGDASHWVFAGGGLAALREDVWRRWAPSFDTDSSCYDNVVTALAPDADGRLWAATHGHGLLLMRGFTQAASCASGQAFYVRPRNDTGAGPRGNVLRAVDVGTDGKVWMAVGRGADDGFGISVLDPRGTYDDSSASPAPWESDDVWAHWDLDGVEGPTNTLVTAIDVRDGQLMVLGTADQRWGDGDGIRMFDAETTTWTAHRTGSTGLPSNHITGIAHDADRGATWFATARRGIARLRHEDGSWSHWLAYDATGTVARVAASTPRGTKQLPVDLSDAVAFETALPGPDRWLRIEGNATIYRVGNFVPEQDGRGPFIELAPPLVAAVEIGATVTRLERGPPGNRLSGVAVDEFGRPWLASFKDRFQAAGLQGSCQPLVDCWLEGGGGGQVGEQPDARWAVFQPADSPVSQFDVSTVAVDLSGKVWFAITDMVASGDGMAVYDLQTQVWERHTISVDMPAGNGVTNLSVDRATGDVWSSHLPVERRVQLPGQPPDIVLAGGGISRWDGTKWRSWSKRDSRSRLVAAGDWGVFYSVLADRHNELVWAGGWDGVARTVHWPSGRGADAVVNWCPIDDCISTLWQHERWKDEGMVANLAVDAHGRVWAATHRYGFGKIPAIGGVKLRLDEEWTALTPYNSPLPSNQISALHGTREGMWVATLSSGVIYYTEGEEPWLVPTPVPTADSQPSPTSEPTVEATVTADPNAPTPTLHPTPGPGGSATASAGMTPATPDAPPTAGTSVPRECVAGDPRCRALLPSAFRLR